MAGQIVNINWDEEISEVALKCGDPFFEDFPKNVYSQSVYRAKRGIAKQYKILDRFWSSTNINGDSEIDINPLNFHGSIRMTIQREGSTSLIPYEISEYENIKDNTDTSVSIYAIIYNVNRYILTYTNPAINDIVTLYYVASIAGEEDFEPYDGNGNPQDIPLLPNKYAEEIIRRAVIYIAELGLAKFEGLKKRKYTTVYQLHSRREDKKEERHLERERGPIEIILITTKYP